MNCMVKWKGVDRRNRRNAYMKSAVSTAVKICIVVMTPCGLLGCQEHFGETYHLNF
jgi:hypothetical protein